MAINSLGASSNGLSGLVSGMDTQQMVESMLSGTQGKIDAAKQKQMTLTYKQTMYRDVAAKLRNFKSSFFDYTSTATANLRSSQFFNTMMAASASNAFKASAVTGATTGKTVVNYVRQLAQNMKLRSKEQATGDLSGTFNARKVQDIADNLADAKNNLKIKAGTDAVVEISLKDLAGKSEFEIEQVLNQKLRAEGSSVSVAFKGGQFTFTDADEEELTISGTEDAMAIVGLGRESELYDENGKITTKLNGKNLLPSLNVTLNGVTKSITINPMAKDANGNLILDGTTGKPVAIDATEFAKQLNKGVQSAFGANAYVTEDGGKIQFHTKDSSSVLSVSRPAQQASALDALGIQSGAATKISLGMAIGNANFATKVLGDTQSFSIGGVDFSFGADTSLSEVISAVNSSNAGVKISYLDVEDKFVLESTTNGELAGVDANNPFGIVQKEGNLLTAMFGAQPGSGASGSVLTYNKSITGTEKFDAGKTFAMKDKTIGISYNGRTYGLKLAGKEDGTDYTLSEMVDELNTLAEEKFGEEQLTFSVVTDGAGKQSLKVEANQGVNFSIASGLSGVEDPDNPDGAKLLNFGIADNTAFGMTIAQSRDTLADLGLTGTTIQVGDTLVSTSGLTTLDDLQKALNTAVKDELRARGVSEDKIANAGASFDNNSGRYRIFGVDIPMTFKISGDENKLFGTSEFTLGSDGVTGIDMTVIQKGQNAIVSINGSEVERASNNFTMNGISFELKEVNFKQDKNADGALLYVDADGTVTTSATSQEKDEDGNLLYIGADGNPTKDPSYVDGSGNTVNNALKMVDNKAKGVDNAEAITVSRDTDKIVDGLKKFVEEYNKLVDDINGLLEANAKEGCRAYPPLTTAQKEGMSEKEIELWEEKSKQGLLRNDRVLEGVMQTLRGAMNTRVDGGKISLYDIGITTTDPLSGTRDHLEFDESKLKQMINEVPDEISKLFTDEIQGVGSLLNAAVENATRTTSGKLGSITLQAGAAGMNITDSFLYKELKSVDERITSLNRTYKSEYERYWSQFNKMEQVIAQMNQQSSWLSQQLGG